MPCPCRAKMVHGSLQSQSSPGPGRRREGGRDLLAGSFLQLPQTARLSLGLVQARALAGRGGVWQVLAGRSSTAAGPLRRGLSQVSIHQLHDLFHLREGRGQDAPGATGLSCLTLHPGSLPRPDLSCLLQLFLSQHHSLTYNVPVTLPYLCSCSKRSLFSSQGPCTCHSLYLACCSPRAAHG